MTQPLASLMGTWAWRWCGLWLLCALWAPPVWAAKPAKVALLIANAAYAREAPLKNPVNDGLLVEQALKAKGFVVTRLENATLKDMQRALLVFGAQAEGADAAVFYYSGHGMQDTDRQNYLLPVDAVIDQPGAVKFNGLRADLITKALADAQPRVALVILDACRNNPFAVGRSATKGLARMEVDGEMLVAYATRDGEIALDGAERNSPYALALAENLVRADEMPVLTLFDRVGESVLERTARRQRPTRMGDLRTSTYLLEPLARPAGAGGGAVAALNPAETAAWEAAKRADTAVAYEAYLRDYPAGAYAASARVLAGARAGQGSAATLVADASPLKGRRAGEVVRDCPSCPELVVVPPGRFDMGAAPGSKGAQPDEAPVRNVQLKQGLAVGRFEVSFQEWDACYAAGGCATNAADEGWGRARQPVIGVSWNDAQAYVAWLSRTTGLKYRLLSEAEWEYAARAGGNGLLPWGNEVGQGHANCYGCGSAWENRQPAPIGSLPANAWGLHDMIGNVWEWVEDCYAPYAQASADGHAAAGDANCQRVLRGGSFQTSAPEVRVADRRPVPAQARSRQSGFRVAREL
jgi:formylglycine-generating enzyme required for sulfatase activity